jgi:hypothetical protein
MVRSDFGRSDCRHAPSVKELMDEERTNNRNLAALDKWDRL